jgi:hypothetical protein
MAALVALLQLVSGIVLSPPYYFLAPFPVEIPAAVILACDRILAPWPGHKDRYEEGALTHLK